MPEAALGRPALVDVVITAGAEPFHNLAPLYRMHPALKRFERIGPVRFANGKRIGEATAIEHGLADGVFLNAPADASFPRDLGHQDVPGIR